MGLDLSAFGNIKLHIKDVDCDNDEIDDLMDDYIHLYQNDNELKQSGGMVTGFYNGTYYDDSEKGVSWSYSGYSLWRDNLIDFTGYGNIGNLCERIEVLLRNNKISSILDDGEESTHIPFVEMTYFSDCEGFIGIETSNKLFNDFKENESKFIAFTETKFHGTTTGDYYINVYKNVMNLFKFASDNKGVVKFH